MSNVDKLKEDIEFYKKMRNQELLKIKRCIKMISTLDYKIYTIKENIKKLTKL